MTADPNRPGQRDDKGRFLPGNAIGAATVAVAGNTKNWQHGLRSARAALPPELAALDAEVAEFLSAALSDEGDAALVSARRRSLLGYRARLDRRVRQLDAALEQRGLLDRRGKLRVAWLQRLEGLIGAARAIDSLLGLARRPKRIEDVTDYLTQYQQTGEPHEHDRRDRDQRDPDPDRDRDEPA